MNSSLLTISYPLIWRLFRKTSEDPEFIEKIEAFKAENKVPQIRCPHCKWSPDRSSRWTCWDCGHPEYFFDGCGTEWNTFDTRGVCPGCSHQWIWTTCLSCWGWSRHEAWYETSDD